MNADEIQEYIRKVKILQTRPDLFLTGILGEKSLEDYHVLICQKIIEYDRLNIKACHAVGKTWIMARLTLWFINCFKNSIVITTAPTNRQVETLLWGEIRKSHRRSKTKLGGKLLNKKLTIDDDWYAMGFSPASGASVDGDEQQGSSFQGFHAKHVMIIFDEATGISKDMYTMAEGLLTSGVIVKFVCIANPTTRACEFFKNTRSAEWHTMTINCFDSPNMKANGFVDIDSVRTEIEILRTLSDYDRMKRIKNYLKPNEYLLNAQWAIAKLYQWGFDHPLSLSKILGEFPSSSDNVVIKWDSVQAALNREVEYEYDKRTIGVDVARYGDDLIVLTDVCGKQVRQKLVDFHKDTVEVTGMVVNLFTVGDQGKETHIVVDATGIGSGVFDNLKELKREGKLPDWVFIHEVHFGNRIDLGSDDEATKEEEKRLNDKYENLKAYIFDKLNEDLRDELQLLREEIYEEELPSIMFKYSKRGRLCIESKEEYKARTGKSPDHADSLALANYGRYLRPSHNTFVRPQNTQKTIRKEHNSSLRNPRHRKSRIRPKSY